MTAAASRLPAAALPAILLSAAVSLAVPGHHVGWVGVLVAGLVLRGVLDAKGREGIDREARVAVWSLLPVFAAVWIGLAHSSDAWGRSLALVTVAQILVLVGPQGGGATAILLALAGGQVAATALLVDAPWTSGAALVWIASAVPAALSVEWKAFESSALSKEAGVRRVKGTASVASTGRIPRPRPLMTTLALLLAGLPLGFLLFAALPESPVGRGGDAGATDPYRGGVEAVPGAGGRENPREGRGDPGDEGNALRADTKRFVSGVRKTLSLGLVSSVKKDATPLFLVKFGDGERGPEPIVLRGTGYDVFTGTEWRRSTTAQAVVARQGGEAGSPRWLPVSAAEAGRRVWRLRVTDLAGKGEGLLFLMPEAESVRLSAVREAGQPRKGIVVSADGTVTATAPFWEGEAYFEQAREAERDRAKRAGRRSDASVAPWPELAAVPRDAAVYLAAAREAVGGETDPGRRAQAIESWLRTRNEYRLEDPSRGPAPSVADFVAKKLPGACEYFASAMVLMMRSLGHPARIAVGFSGGDYLETTSEWSFRASHAHAWCEVWFEGLGWAAYDPTPPDPSAGSGRGGAGAGGEDATDGPTVWERLARWTSEDRRWLRDRIGGALKDAWDTGSILWIVALGLGGLAFAIVLRSLRRRGIAIAGSAGSGSVAPVPVWPPYARALSALASAGCPRGGAETASEHEARASAAIPPASVPFAGLTRAYETYRFGDHPPTPEDERAAGERAAAVEKAADERRKAR